MAKTRRIPTPPARRDDDAAAKPAARIEAQKTADPAFDRDGNRIRDEQR